jgi:hypothetical protein
MRKAQGTIDPVFKATASLCGAAQEFSQHKYTQEQEDVYACSQNRQPNGPASLMRSWEFMGPPLAADRGDVQGIDKARGSITTDPQRHGGKDNIRVQRQAGTDETAPRTKPGAQHITR